MVSGINDCWNEDVLLSVVFVFAFRKVCPVPVCLVFGRIFFLSRTVMSRNYDRVDDKT